MAATVAHAALYFDNSKKLETLTDGVNVTGDITVSGTVDGTDVATDGTKLDGIEASADVTDTANVTAAGALMDSEVTNLAQIKGIRLVRLRHCGAGHDSRRGYARIC